MATRYKLHHVGLLCDDTEKSAAFYRDVLQHEQIGRFYAPNEYDLTFLASGSDLLIELVGRPFGGDEQTFFDERGAGIHHIAFEVENVDAAFAELTASGLKVAWEPDDVLFLRHCGVYDDCGRVVEILQQIAPLPAPKRSAATEFKQGGFRLHHGDLFTDDWQRTKQFYASHFGCRSIFEYIYDHGGAFIYLVDSYYDGDSHPSAIELIGPPYEETREFEFAKRFGTGMDHIGYEVANVREAYAHVLARGSSDLREPYSDYGTSMCWVQDADGNDLELMLPVDKAQLKAAFASGVPFRPNGFHPPNADKLQKDEGSRMKGEGKPKHPKQ